MENRNHGESKPESIPMVIRRINVASRDNPDDEHKSNPHSDLAPVDPTDQGVSHQGGVVPFVSVEVDNSPDLVLINVNLDDQGGSVEGNEIPSVNQGVTGDDVALEISPVSELEESASVTNPEQDGNEGPNENVDPHATNPASDSEESAAVTNPEQDEIDEGNLQPNDNSTSVETGSQTEWETERGECNREIVPNERGDRVEIRRVVSDERNEEAGVQGDEIEGPSANDPSNNGSLNIIATTLNSVGRIGHLASEGDRGNNAREVWLSTITEASTAPVVGGLRLRGDATGGRRSRSTRRRDAESGGANRRRSHDVETGNREAPGGGGVVRGRLRRFNRWQPSRRNWLWKLFKIFFDALRLPAWKDAVADGISIYKRIGFLLLGAFSLLFALWASVDLVWDNHKNPVKVTRNPQDVQVYNVLMFTHAICINCNFKLTALNTAMRIFEKVTSLGEFTHNGVTWDLYSTGILIYTIFQKCGPKTAMERAYSSPAMLILKDFVEGNSYLFTNERETEVLKNKVFPFIKQGQFTPNEALGPCVLFGEIVNCNNYFVVRQTEMGSCFIFNGVPNSIKYKSEDNIRGALDQEDISPEELAKWETANMGNFDFERGRPFGAPDGKRNKSAMPLFQPVEGFPYGLSYTIRVNTSESACCQGRCPGFTVATYPPSEEPNLLKSGTVISFNTENYIGVIPRIKMANPEIFSISAERRRCYKDDETIFLKHFKFYSISNCQAECEAEAIYEKCHCNILSLPSGLGDNLCRPSEFSCVVDARASLYAEGNEERCKHCLPTCSQMTIRTELSSITYDSLNPPQHVLELVGKENLHEVRSAVIHVAYIEQNIPADKISFALSTLELISLVCGLLGMTSGCTFIDVGRFLNAASEVIEEIKKRPWKIEAMLRMAAVGMSVEAIAAALNTDQTEDAVQPNAEETALTSEDEQEEEEETLPESDKSTQTPSTWDIAIQTDGAASSETETPKPIDDAEQSELPTASQLMGESNGATSTLQVPKEISEAERASPSSSTRTSEIVRRLEQRISNVDQRVRRWWRQTRQRAQAQHQCEDSQLLLPEMNSQQTFQQVAQRGGRASFIVRGWRRLTLRRSRASLLPLPPTGVSRANRSGKKALKRSKIPVPCKNTPEGKNEQPRRHSDPL